MAFLFIMIKTSKVFSETAKFLDLETRLCPSSLKIYHWSITSKKITEDGQNQVRNAQICLLF